MSIAVPCCNNAVYMDCCIRALLHGGEEVEILVADDGSQKDNTGEITDRYEREYPTICRAIHQVNGGHGAAIMTGLKNASGVFFKVVDSDDWVDPESYDKILDTLRDFMARNTQLDLLISNFVYKKEGAARKRVMNYRKVLSTERLVGWDEIGHFLPGRYILMHSVIYRTALLESCGLELPTHTFYVDNIFAYQSLPRVKTLYYLDMNFYRYYIDREDRSANEQVMIGHIDQQLRVTRLMVESCDPYKIPQKKLRRYMVLYLEVMMTICSILAVKSEFLENLEKKKEIWRYLKQQSPRLYLRIRFGFLGQSMNLPGKGGRKISIVDCKITQKFYGFN